MAKALKFFGGMGYLRPEYKRKGCKHEQVNIYIAAYTKKEAVELLGKVTGFPSLSTLNNYYSSAWGTYMDEIKAGVTHPCVYVNETWNHLHTRLIYTK